MPVSQDFLVLSCPCGFGEMQVLPINLGVSVGVSHHSLESDTLMGLTAVAIKAAKGRAKQYKMAESDGLYLLVKPNGGRFWRMNYRFRGFYKTLAFGSWPEIALIDARARRDEARREIARGIDPGEKLKLNRTAADVAATILAAECARGSSRLSSAIWRRGPRWKSSSVCAATLAQSG